MVYSNPRGTLNFLKCQAKAFPNIAQVAPNLVHFDAYKNFLSFTLIRIALQPTTYPGFGEKPIKNHRPEMT
jgi:hypothetical protein